MLVNSEFTLKSEEACFTGAAGGEEAEESLDGEATEAVVILSEAGDGGGEEAAVTSVVVIVGSSSAIRSSLESPFSSGSSFIARTHGWLGLPEVNRLDHRDAQRSLRPICHRRARDQPALVAHSLSLSLVRSRSRSATK